MLSVTELAIEAREKILDCTVFVSGGAKFEFFDSLLGAVRFRIDLSAKSVDARQHLRLGANSLFEIGFGCGVLVTPNLDFGHDEVHVGIVRIRGKSRLCRLLSGGQIVVAEVSGCGSKQCGGIAGRDVEGLQVFGLCIIVSVELVVDISEQDVTCGGSRVKSLEPRQRRQGKFLIGLH